MSQRRMTPEQVFLLVFYALSWGGTYVVTVLALEGLSPVQVVWARCAVGFVVVGTAVALRGGETRARVRDLFERPRPALTLAVVGMIAPWVLIAFAQKAVPAGVTGILIASMPLWSAGYAALFDVAEAVNLRQGLGLVLGLVGVGLVVGVEAVHTVDEALGAAAILLAAGLFSLGTFGMKREYADVPAVSATVIMLGVSTVILAPLGVLGGDVDLGLRPVLGALLLGACCTALPMALLFTLVAQVGPRRAALASYMGPCFTLALAAVFLDERIGVGALGGLALVIAGVVLAARVAPRTSAGAAAPSPPAAPAADAAPTLHGACPTPSPTPSAAPIARDGSA